MRNHHILSIAALLIFTACNKDIPLKSPSFGVTADSASYKTGSTATFKFTGNPDNITFYSGTWGNRYQYSKRYNDTSGTDILTFSTAITTAGASGSLSLLVSTDFSNDTSKVSSATWTDVSTISPITWATGTTTVASGSINLTSLKASGKPIYLAFKYSATAGTTQAKWTISNITLNHKPTGDTTYTILNAAAINPVYAPASPQLISSPGWAAVNISRNPTAAQLWTPTVGIASTAALVIAGNTTAASSIASEQWIIAGPIDLTQVLHDVPTAIVKNTASLNASALAPPLTYKYTLSGNYAATFVGVNAAPSGMDSLVKTITVPVQ